MKIVETGLRLLRHKRSIMLKPSCNHVASMFSICTTVVIIAMLEHTWGHVYRRPIPSLVKNMMMFCIHSASRVTCGLWPYKQSSKPPRKLNYEALRICGVCTKFQNFRSPWANVKPSIENFLVTLLVILPSTFAIGNPERHVRKASQITLLLLVHATYIWCCSSRAFRSWWTAHSAQRQRRGCNSPYHRRHHKHKNTKKWLAMHQYKLQNQCLHVINIERSKTLYHHHNCIVIHRSTKMLSHAAVAHSRIGVCTWPTLRGAKHFTSTCYFLHAWFQGL